MPKYTDLKLVDELLCDYMRLRDLRPEDMEGAKGSNITQAAIERLRQAWEGGEMEKISATWALYFERTKGKK